MILTEKQRIIMIQFADELLEMDEIGAIDLDEWPNAEKFIAIVKRSEHA